MLLLSFSCADTGVVDGCWIGGYRLLGLVCACQRTSMSGELRRLLGSSRHASALDRTVEHAARDAHHAVPRSQLLPPFRDPAPPDSADGRDNFGGVDLCDRTDSWPGRRVPSLVAGVCIADGSAYEPTAGSPSARVKLIRLKSRADAGLVPAHSRPSGEIVLRRGC